MIRDWRIIVVLVTSVVLPGTSRAQAPDPRSEAAALRSADLRPSATTVFPPSSSIHGQVVDERGRALPRVRVRALGPTTMVSTTDARGAFRFSSLPPGAYLVRAYAAGYNAAMSGRIDLGTGSAPTLRLTLVTAEARTGLARSETPPAELAAGFGVPDAVGAVETSGVVETPDVVEGQRGDDQAAGRDGQGGGDDGETAWRMRHLKRSPLREIETSAGMGWTAGDAFIPEATAAVQRAVETSVRMASALFDLSLSGEVNLLTSGAFDRPEQLFSSNRFARNVAYVSLGAPAGDVGTWAVRAAMTQGDVSSWILAGFLVAPDTRRHAYDVGMSYSMQRYTGGNPAALAAVTDGARNAADVHGFDRWAISPTFVLGYGARYSHYDYLGGGGWLSPRITATVTPAPRFRVHLLAARRMVAPGAEEFVPSMSAGLWLPPERTFSPLVARHGFRVERSDHYEAGVEHDLNAAVVVAFRTYRQSVNDQLVTLFNVRRETAGPSELGHYYVATAGDVRTRGWAASVSHELGTIRSTVEYSLTQAEWVPGASADIIGRTAASALRRGAEDLADLTTSVRAAIPQTATRVYVLYRLNTGFARVDEVRTDARFDVQINQALPFLNFHNAQWEMLLDVRNLFRDPASGASVYDELLVVHPPKRIVGGILVRF